MPYSLPMISKALLAALVILCGPGMPSARADEPAAPIEVEDETVNKRLTHDHGFRHLLDIMELYETALGPAAVTGTVFMVGGMLSYFFEW